MDTLAIYIANQDAIELMWPSRIKVRNDPFAHKLLAHAQEYLAKQNAKLMEDEGNKLMEDDGN